MRADKHCRFHGVPASGREGRIRSCRRGNGSRRERRTRGSCYDECGRRDGVRTNYALVSRQARAVFLSLDNGAERSPSYEGFSAAEMGFAEDVLEYARKESLPLLVVAHIPPNTLLNEGAPVPPRPPSVEERVRAQRAWIVGLRERHPSTLFVFGHLHPLRTRMDPADADVDLDGGQRRRE